MKIYVVGSSKNKFLPLDDIRQKFLIDEKHNDDNIDFLNPWYCELTGLYHLWKNCDDEIVGLEHYRRYFVNRNGDLLSKAEIDEILKHNDVIAHLSRDIGTTIYDAPSWCHRDKISMTEYAKRVLFCLRHNYPQHKTELADVMFARKHWQGNMIICKKEILSRYCRWLFVDFKKMFEEFKPDYIPPRCMGYMSELFLFPFWCKMNKITIFNCERKEIK